MLKKILVPVDFSNTAQRALEYAIELGRPFKAEIVVVHVLEPIYFGGTADLSGIADLGFAYPQIERAAQDELKAVQAQLRRRRVPARTLLLAGSAPRSIANCARKLKVDLIVMSTHGRSGLSHVFLGSVAEAVLREAPCPVLTVHKTTAVIGVRKRRARKR